MEATLKDCAAEEGYHSYEITLVTGSHPNAGTECRIHLQLIGDRASTPEKLLAGTESLTPGSISTYSFDAYPVGNVVAIMVRMDGEGYKDSWLVKEIHVYDTELQRHWEFKPDMWLTKDRGYQLECKPLNRISLGLSANIRRRSALYPPPTASPSPPLIQPSQPLIFIATYYTKESHQVYLLGSSVELGEWDEDRALRMERYCSPNGSWAGEWRLSIDLERSPAFEYNYLVRNEVDFTVTWEIGDKRVADPCGHVVESSPAPGSRTLFRAATEVVIRDKVLLGETPVPTTVTPSMRKTLSSFASSSPLPKFRIPSPAASTQTPRRGFLKGLPKPPDEKAKELEELKHERIRLDQELQEAKKFEGMFQDASRNLDVLQANLKSRQNLAVEQQIQIKSLEKELLETQTDAKRKILSIEKQKDGTIEKLETQLISLREELQEAQSKIADLEAHLQGVRERGACVDVLEIEKHTGGMQRSLEELKAQQKETAQHKVLFGRLAKMSTVLVQECEDANERWRKEFTERRKLYNEIQELKGNIRVFCRVRPTLRSGSSDICSFPDRDLEDPRRIAANGKNFDFDRVFAPSDTQDAVYRAAAGIITSVLDGYNVCVFAYGQTGSGKTFTMNGSADERGVNYRALEDLFRLKKEREKEFETTVTVSLLEIYNEQLLDLHTGATKEKRLEIKRGADGRVHIPALDWVQVQCVDDVWQVIERSCKNRSMGATDMNQHSSRSHLVVSVQAKSKNRFTLTTSTGMLHLIDLAGSERISKSNATGGRLKEAQHINKSLAALGDVFMGLLAKNQHIPYRNSKLTYFLQDCLGGDSKNLMFVNISPEDGDLTETISSLNFASRVAQIQGGGASKHTESGETLKAQRLVREKDEELIALRARQTDSENDVAETREKLDAVREQHTRKVNEMAEQLSIAQRALQSSQEEVRQLRLTKQTELSTEKRRLSTSKRESDTLVDELRSEVANLRSKISQGSHDRLSAERAIARERIRSPPRAPLSEVAGVNVSSDSDAEQRVAKATKGLRHVRFEEVEETPSRDVSPTPSMVGKMRERPKKALGSASRGGAQPAKKIMYAFGSRIDNVANNVPTEPSQEGDARGPRNRGGRVVPSRMKMPAERVAKRGNAGTTPLKQLGGMGGRRLY